MLRPEKTKQELTAMFKGLSTESLIRLLNSKVVDFPRSIAIDILASRKDVPLSPLPSTTPTEIKRKEKRGKK